ncbi:adenylate kinase [Candidatus Bathyarchaeota archaeon]|nr:MAG: adenylate kinase [Candidatus Bathyarchaeota archaeon]
MRRLIIVTGIPGTGKTTVCKELKKLVGEKMEIVNFGTVMVKLAEKMGKKLHRDDIRKHSVDFQRKLQIEAAKEIAKKAENFDGILIVDTHMVIRTQEGYWAGLPHKVLQILNPSMFILIEAEPKEILERRFKDADRKRDKVLREEIVEELSFSRFFAASCASITGAPVKIVKNPSGKQIEAAKEILKIWEGTLNEP